MDLETFDPSLLHLSFFEVIERYPSAIFDLERLVDSVPDSESFQCKPPRISSMYFFDLLKLFQKKNILSIF